MYGQKDIDFVKQEIFGLLGFEYAGNIDFVEGDMLKVEADENKAVITYSQKCELARGLFLLAKELLAGKKDIMINQKSKFEYLGVMLDFSRGSVFKPASVKEFILNMAALGMNEAYLYLEDIYEVKEYPYFGHMRGRYSKAEINDIDVYAQKLGVEIIPCVQTLAHLRTYLRWSEASEIKDTDQVLLIGEEKTYDFIRTLVKTLSSMFSSRRIHIGMDEAHTMGQGQYAKRNKVVDRKQMFIDHLERVKEICTEEGLSPVMWSDMPFRVCGGEGGVNEEYDPNSVITNDISKAVDGVNLSYWDYYRTDYSQYESIIRRHQKMTPNISFAGAVWTWDGYLPNFKYTFDTMIPAMRACIDCGINEVYATMWGTNGTDTDYMQAIAGLAVFSEYCYLGNDCTEDDVFDAAYALTGLNKEVLLASSAFFAGYDGAWSMGERLVDADLMYESFRYPIDYKKKIRIYEEALSTLKKYDSPFAVHASLAIEIALVKSQVFDKLRSSYKSKDMAVLKEIAYDKLERLEVLYEKFFGNYEDIMEKTRKPFGTEIIHIRFAGIRRRLSYAHSKIKDYVDGKIDVIPELEEPALNNEKLNWLSSETYMKTM